MQSNQRIEAELLHKSGINLAANPFGSLSRPSRELANEPEPDQMSGYGYGSGDSVLLGARPESVAKVVGGAALQAPLVAGAIGGVALIGTTILAESAAVGVGAVVKSGLIGLTAGALAAGVSCQALLLATLPPLNVQNVIFSSGMLLCEGGQPSARAIAF